MLDETPVTVMLSASLLGHTLGAVRSQLKKRERSLARSDFTPELGRLNLNEIKIGKLREAEATLQAALSWHLDGGER